MDFTTKDVAYCVGMSIGESLASQDLGTLDAMEVAEGIKAIFEKQAPKFSPEQANFIIQNYVNKLSAEKYAVNKEEGVKFLAENAKRPEIKTTASGLQYEVLKEGDGKKPAATDTVEVHYHGTLIDGTVFDSSVQRNQTAKFGVHQVIKGWTEALQLMSEGSKFRLYIPEELAYGANPHPGGAIKPHMALIFDVELIKVQ
ncbi:MAG: FKBP-type peptidyl-prolyl cis-trans isomerase [Flavobacteriia bacterium]|nr:FKBP-type peptidyl-prolyl cis-trans isomerase [Flavobacteriia bacterium]OJX36104.1 MAG: peptidylprolyl isomerase [Flavobacteriia bacterium 40-80]